MTGPEMSLVEARSQVRRVVDQLEAVRLQLMGLSLSLPKPPAEGPEDDSAGESEALRDFRATLECVLVDDIRPAIEDLQAVTLS